MKKIFTFFAALTIMISASAQTRNIEQTCSFGMPYVGVFAGAAAPLNSFNESGWTSYVLPTAGLELGTYVTPVWGASAEGSVLFNTQESSQPAVAALYVLGNGKMNLSNLFGGYKGYPRKAEVVLVAGAGWSRGYANLVMPGDDSNGSLMTTDEMVYNTGAEVNFNLGKSRAWQINIKPSVVWSHDADNQFGFDKNYATARINAGVTYKFGCRKTNSHNFVTNNYEVTRYDYDVLMARYEECHNREPEKIEVPVEVVVEKTVEVPVMSAPQYFGESMVIFPCGSATLSANNKEVIRHFFENAQDGAVIYILGSADSATGTKKFNYELANKRAQVVKAELIKLGADENEIELDTTLDGGSTIRASRCTFLSIKNSVK